MAYNYSPHPIPLHGGPPAVPSSYEPDRSAQDHNGWQEDHFPDRRDHPAYPNPPRDGPSRYPPFAGTPGTLQQHGNMSGGRQIISQEVRQVQQVVTSYETSSTAYHSPPPSINFGGPSAYQEEPSQHPENFYQSHEAAYRVNQSTSGHFQGEYINDQPRHGQSFHPPPETPRNMEAAHHFHSPPPTYQSPPQSSFGARPSYDQAGPDAYPNYNFQPEVPERPYEDRHARFRDQPRHPEVRHGEPHSGNTDLPGPDRNSRRSDGFRSGFKNRRGGKEYGDAWNSRKNRSSFPPRGRLSDGPSSSNRKNSGRRWEGLEKTVPKSDEKKKQDSKVDNSSAQKQEAKEPKNNEEKVESSEKNQAGNDQQASTSSSVPSSSSAGDTPSSAGEPMEVDPGVTYLHTFRKSRAQERAVDLPNDTADIELNLPDLAQIRRAIVFDTSVLLSDEGEKFFELMKGLEDAQYLRDILFLMPYTVLEELDHLKGRTEENIARRSRIASGFWCERISTEGTCFSLQSAENDHRPARKVSLRTGDDRIVNCFVQLYDKLAPERLVCLVTNDHIMIMKAVSMSGIGEKDRKEQIMDSKAFMKKLQQILKAELEFKTGHRGLVVAEPIPDLEQEDCPMEGVGTNDPQTVAQSIAVLHQLYQCLDRALLSLLKVFLEKRLTLAYNGEVWKDMFDKPDHWLTPERIVAFLLKHWHPFTAGAQLEKQKSQFESLIPSVDSAGATGQQALEKRIQSRARSVYSLIGIIEAHEDKGLRMQYQHRLDFMKGKLALWNDLCERAGTAEAVAELARETSAFLSPGT